MNSANPTACAPALIGKPQLPERNRHQQGSGDRTKGETRHFDPAHEIAEAEQQEQRDDRLPVKEGNERVAS